MTNLFIAEQDSADFPKAAAMLPDNLRVELLGVELLGVELLNTLAQQDYRFITVTPLTHQRFLARNTAVGKNVQDILGWNLPFELETLAPPLRRIMLEAGLVTRHQHDSLLATSNLLRSRVRVSSLADDLLLHSAFPTSSGDAVFFGPDTYRFSRFIRQALHEAKSDLAGVGRPLRVLDIGCGSGAGGLTVARSLGGRALDLTLNDINPVALDYARVNMQAAAINAHFLLGDVFTTPHGEFDLIISNPPYMKDSAGRAYRNGGERLGLDFSERLVQHSIRHLAPGGRLLLYTGVAMTAHSDPFLENLIPLFKEMGCHWSYEEIDPDVFGEELEQPAYAAAHRIAAVGLVVTRLD